MLLPAEVYLQMKGLYDYSRRDHPFIHTDRLHFTKTVGRGRGGGALGNITSKIIPGNKLKVIYEFCKPVCTREIWWR